MPYTPSQKTLEKYADVLVNLALNGGKGIKKGDVVNLIAPENAKPLYREIIRAILRSGGHVISRYLPENSDRYNFDRDFFKYASDEQISFFPAKYLRGLIDQIDHILYISSETNPHALKNIPPEKIMRKGEAYKPFSDWRNEKENKGKFTWTIALYPSPAMAKEAGLSYEEYWNQVKKACFLNEKDPKKKWRRTFKQIERYEAKLNKLPIDKLHIKGPETDLWIKLGEKRKWTSGGGYNIPSFEIFTSPDWRGTEGWIKFNQPLYAKGNMVEGIELEFKNGKISKYKAKKNEKFLKSMITTKNADKVGEFSLTDKKLSRITKFMAEMLYDENAGGKHGNTHIALGRSFQDCFAGNPRKLKKKDWARLGFNDSSVHTDLVSTAPRTVTAYLKNGKVKTIYRDGEFVI